MCHPGASVLGPKRTPKWVQEQPKSGSLFGSIFGPILGSLLGVFWVPSGPQDWPGRGLEEPKRAKWSSERPKRRLSKKWFSHRTVCIFSLLRPPKTAPRGPEDCQRASRGSSEAKEKSPQRELKKGRILGPFWGRFWGPFWGPKNTKKYSEKGSRK